MGTRSLKPRGFIHLQYFSIRSGRAWVLWPIKNSPLQVDLGKRRFGARLQSRVVNIKRNRYFIRSVPLSTVCPALQIKSGGKKQKNQDIISSASVSTQRISPFVTKLSLSPLSSYVVEPIRRARQTSMMSMRSTDFLVCKNPASPRFNHLLVAVDIVLMRCS